MASPPIITFTTFEIPMAKKIIYKRSAKKAKNRKVDTGVFHPKEDITFFEKVYEVVRLIPKGRVTSYGAIAKFLGTAGSSRMVGWAMNSSHTAIPSVPAQRVVNRNGLLTGKAHFNSKYSMEQMLKNDGVKVEDDKVLRFKELFWDPMIELNIE